jgi:hypothetical protein
MHGALLVAACLLAACSDSDSDPAASTAAPPTAATTLVTTSSAGTASTTTVRGLGNYNVTPLRRDGQRVTFRLTVPDGVVGEVSFAPADTVISMVEPSIELRRPGGAPAGGGGIFGARADDPFFTNFCSVALGGNCTPRSSDALADGNRFESFSRAAGGDAMRVVFGPWAMFVQGRVVADAFVFHNGPDGFPLVTPRGGGFTTANAYVRVYTTAGPRYHLRSDPSGACDPAGTTAQRCDRGLSIDGADATVRRI